MREVGERGGYPFFLERLAHDSIIFDHYGVILVAHLLPLPHTAMDPECVGDFGISAGTRRDATAISRSCCCAMGTRSCPRNMIFLEMLSDRPSPHFPLLRTRLVARSPYPPPYCLIFCLNDVVDQPSSSLSSGSSSIRARLRPHPPIRLRSPPPPLDADSPVTPAPASTPMQATGLYDPYRPIDPGPL